MIGTPMTVYHSLEYNPAGNDTEFAIPVGEAVEADGIFAHAAMGDGGNVICCIPAKDLVVAIASAFVMNPSDRWTLIKENIIPAV